MSRTRTVSLTLGSIALGAVLATGVTGLAQADDSTTAPASSAVAGQGPHDRGMHGDPRRGGDRGDMRRGEPLHGEMVVKAEDGTITTVREIRGEVSAVSSSSITVTAEDGYTATFAIDDQTVVRVGLPERGSADDSDTIADVQVGDVAHIHGTVTGSTATAERVMAMTADEAAQLDQLRQQHQQEHAAAASGASSTQVG
jgi:hypothetical protein